MAKGKSLRENAGGAPWFLACAVALSPAGCGSDEGPSVDGDRSSFSGEQRDAAAPPAGPIVPLRSTEFDAALFIRAFASYLELTSSGAIDGDLIEAAIEENDYEGRAFASALDLLNLELEERGERPIPRPLPEGLGLDLPFGPVPRARGPDGGLPRPRVGGVE